MAPSPTDPPEVFTAPWGESWCRALDASERYREAGRRWDGPLALVLEADGALGVPRPRGLILDLSAGRCRGCEALVGEASEADPLIAGLDPAVETVLVGPAATWARILAGELEPLLAVTLGRLRLARGSLAALLPHAQGAQALVRVARELPTRLPPGWAKAP